MITHPGVNFVLKLDVLGLKIELPNISQEFCRATLVEVAVPVRANVSSAEQLYDFLSRRTIAALSSAEGFTVQQPARQVPARQLRT